MKKFKTVIFDLDGTLLNTIEDIKDSMNMALEDNGFKTYTTEEYYYLVGSGIKEMIEEAISEENCSLKLVDKLIADFRSYYMDNWNKKSKLYDGVTKMLHELKQADLKIAILSNKPHDFTELMVSTLIPEFRFDFVMGHKEPFPIKPDPQSANFVLSKLNTIAEDTAFVGDSNVDILTAINAKLYPIGVKWGFRPVKELVSSGAKYIAQSPQNLANFILGKTMS